MASGIRLRSSGSIRVFQRVRGTTPNMAPPSRRKPPWKSPDTDDMLRRTLGDRDAVLLGELGSSYLGRGDFEKARALTAAAHRLQPLNPAIADAYGWALFKAGDRAGARQILRQAVATAPGHPGLRAHLERAEAAR